MKNKSSDTPATTGRTINRRQFIQLLAALSASWPAHSMTSGKSINQTEKDIDIELKEPWLTLSSVQQHLFPADETSPGAKDINALAFLQNMLDAPDTTSKQKDFIVNGVGWLNELSVKNHQQSFSLLSSPAKEKVLRQIESSSAGSRWLSLMMTYLIEALLSDPVYGGNKDQRGWQWLEHIPGFPTPSSDQVYFKLAASTRRRTKA